MFGKNHKKGFILLILLTAGIARWHFYALGSYLKKPIYGQILGIDDGDIKDAIVEKVALYAKKDNDSNQKIVRNGLLVRYKDAIATIVICHGFMCDKYDAGFLRPLLPKGRFNFLTFDFRAHGENVEGQCCTFGRDEAFDVISAAKFVKNHPDLRDLPILGYGFSMGAVSLIEAQAKEPLFKGMVLDCPFDSTENIIKRGLENVKFSMFGYEFNIPGRSLLQKYAFHPYIQSLVKVVLKTVAHMDSQNININICPINPVQTIKKVEIPCFFIHCKNDEKVSVSALKSVFEGAKGYKKLWLTNGRRHFDSFFYNPEKYTMRIQKFLEKVIKEKLNNEKSGKIIEDDDEIS